MIESLYIHFPFCLSKCHYCAFYSVKFTDVLFRKYITSLQKELLLYRSKYDLTNIKTLYIGGGNPSLNFNALNEINSTITSSITLRNLIEYTVECNPVNINKELLQIFKKNNVNRVSLGIQSFDEKVLRRVNRVNQNIDNINDSLELLNKNNFNISIDLINGLQEQKPEYEINELDKVLKRYSNIRHISFYDLSIDDGSYYHKQNFDINCDNSEFYFKLFKKLLNRHSFKRYEISNYAKDKKYSIHNLNYWNYRSYLGIGPQAHSTIGNVRIENKSDIEAYNNYYDYNKECQLTIKEQIQEYILMGFRLVSGIELKEFKRRYNYSILQMFQNTIDKYFKQGKIKKTSKYIKMSNSGLQILNQILIDFFKELDTRNLD